MCLCTGREENLDGESWTEGHFFILRYRIQSSGGIIVLNDHPTTVHGHTLLLQLFVGFFSLLYPKPLNLIPVKCIEPQNCRQMYQPVKTCHFKV